MMGMRERDGMEAGKYEQEVEKLMPDSSLEMNGGKKEEVHVEINRRLAGVVLLRNGRSLVQGRSELENRDRLAVNRQNVDIRMKRKRNRNRNEVKN